MGITNRVEFLNLAGLVEGGTILVALGGGWLLGVSPWSSIAWSGEAVAVGLLATLPILGVFHLATGPRTVAVEMLGEALSRCRWYDLILLAALAGFGEELLFRGVLQPWLAQWSAPFAFLAANLAFGVMHAVTPSYALVATGVGMYLSWLAYGIGESNLLRAIIAHGVYDAIAFGLVVRQYRSTMRTQGSE
ncbi:MAG: CPBP family intramembrane metalloprotease [Planctomycetaceae bacterium]|nr:CPBP family intramembrane metalloprotease [Planctomycetaceae bacterium]